MMLNLRLGAVEVPPGAVCMLAKRSDEEQCLVALDSPLTHPFLCKCGPARLRPHRAICHKLAHLLRRTGDHVDIERAVPQLYKVGDDGDAITEAILDVVSSHPGGLSKAYVDVTIRAPHATRYANTDKFVGIAAKGGETDKLERYGVEVLPLSFEPYGRLGPSSMRALRTLAMNAASHLSFTVSVSGHRLYGNWRAQLERTLLFEMADVVLLALGHNTGLFARRSR